MSHRCHRSLGLGGLSWPLVDFVEGRAPDGVCQLLYSRGHRERGTGLWLPFTAVRLLHRARLTNNQV
ncbi:hypothetical protein GDO86_000664 [Hymenochirus boettgeri]|uniref:Uncharacterized protein n=1 Tax=Hymenochirus boettgeri TaxID=247094 RepID=A0A8T2KFC7_9PIPI|nr:hypothetical protein GDO86_000664 [Hymenochirus boettgeri]